MGNKSVFWQALIFTILIFGAGLVFGYYLESSRASNVELNLLGSEVNLLDEQMRARVVEESNLSCDLSKQSLFAFADKIYEEVLKLERYDSSAKFDRETLMALHKRYDLLRTMLWFEGIKLRERCGGFHNVIYFFNYASDNVETRARQGFFSRLLEDVKKESPNEILLIPIASNLNLASVEIAMKSYNVDDAPSILIDEKKIVEDIVTLDEIKGHIFSSSK